MRKYQLNEKGVKDLINALPQGGNFEHWKLEETSKNILCKGAYKPDKSNHSAKFTVYLDKFTPTNEWAATFQIETLDLNSHKMFLNYLLSPKLKSAIRESLGGFFGGSDV